MTDTFELDWQYIFAVYVPTILSFIISLYLFHGNIFLFLLSFLLLFVGFALLSMGILVILSDTNLIN